MSRINHSYWSYVHQLNAIALQAKHCNEVFLSSQQLDNPVNDSFSNALASRRSISLIAGFILESAAEIGGTKNIQV